MRPQTREKIRRWGPYLVAALWLVLGYANLVRGVAHPAVAYRPWAFDHHSYSDLLAMTGDRYLGGGRPVPYLEDRIEYPVLLGLLLWAPSLLPGGQLAHFTFSYAVLALCLFAGIFVLRRLPGASPWWLAGTPAIAYYAGLNWDLFPILLMLLSLLFAERGRLEASGMAGALGVSAKLWPAAVLPPLVGALTRRDQAGLARLALAFAAVTLTVNLPFALLAPRNWSWFFRFNAGRGPENSIWEALKVSSPTLVSTAGLAFLGAASAIAAAAAFRAAIVHRLPVGRGLVPRRIGAGQASALPGQPFCSEAKSEDATVDHTVRLGTALVLVTWIATNKVWSPQYALYGFAAAALVSAPTWMFFVLSAVAAVDYHLAFEVRSSRALFWYFDSVYYAEEWVRTAAWALLLVWIGRELIRAVRAGAAEGATA
jgi:hypothetical protein